MNKILIVVVFISFFGVADVFATTSHVIRDQGPYKFLISVIFAIVAGGIAGGIVGGLAGDAVKNRFTKKSSSQ